MRSRSFGLILLLISSTLLWAEEPPPARIMVIQLNDGVNSWSDSILCSRIDPAVGVAFVDNNRGMKVGISDLIVPDPYFPVYKKITKFYLTSQITGISFVPVPQPVTEVPVEGAPATE